MPTAKIWRALGAPDFSPHVRQLLKLANAKYTADTRSSLVSTLNLAWAEVELTRKLQKQRIPARLFDPLNDSVKRTQKLLRRLEMDHLPDIAIDEWAVLNRRAITPGKMFDEVPPGATIVAFNRHQMLDRLLRDLARYNPKRKRGHQQERDKLIIVAGPVTFSGNTRLSSLPAIPMECSPYFARDFTRLLRVSPSVVVALSST